jgi:hypothetical protein
MLYVYVLAILLALVIYSRMSQSLTRECIFSGGSTCWPVITRYANYREAAQLLEKLNQRLMFFLEWLRKKYHVGESDDTIALEGPEHDVARSLKQRANVENLLRRYNYEAVYENDPLAGDTTSYTISKGRAMYLCLRRKDRPEELVDEHTLFFVILHEISHIANYADVGHTPLFWRVFKFILEEARQSGAHAPANYTVSPVMFCGLKIDYSPYHDNALLPL